MTAADIEAVAAKLAALGDSSARAGRDPVNLPMIRNWAEALGVSLPSDRYVPPAMIQVWTMPGLRGARGGDDPLGTMSQVLDEAGYTSVVATNCSQRYLRYLSVGESLSVRARLLDVTGPKRTSLGEGWFVTTRSTWSSASGEEVATMDFRILKFKPAVAAAAPAVAAPVVMRPAISKDTEFFWAGTRAGELRIQRCPACSALRHPPGPMCPACGTDARPSYVVASGTGTVYSYVVHHHPPVPGKQPPFVIALVELAEGVRVTGELRGVSPEEVRIGMPVRMGFDRVDADLTMPVWRPELPGELPPLRIDVTPTFVVSSALATRDFQDVHHDRDLAVARGSKDIFINILTTTGLVQRYASEAFPGTVIREIDIRLGVPCYAGDTLTLTGQVVSPDPAGSPRTMTVTGRCSLGDHVTGTVQFSPEGS